MFCNHCIKQKAEIQAGSMQYELKCFDTSGCQAPFSSKLIRKVIGDKLMKRLEDLQQQDEIAKASIDGLEECPFCDFKAICPPVEQNKEFTCLNSDCEKVSCRLCKEETHIPQTCEEAKKERGLEVRHAVEEAMTAALIRKCPKCGLAIVKEDGCNKLKCRCGALICDVCKKEISKDGYMHFQVRSNTCNLYDGDTGVRRRMNEVMQAEKAAMAEVLAQGGNIDPEMLRVTSKQEVSVNEQAPTQRGMPVNTDRPRVQMPQLPEMPRFQILNVAQMPQAYGVPQMTAPILPREVPFNAFPQMPRLATLNPLSQPNHFPRVPEAPVSKDPNVQSLRRPPRTATPGTLLTAQITRATPERQTSTALATSQTITPAISMTRLPSTTAQRQTASTAPQTTTPRRPPFRGLLTTPQQTPTISAAPRTATAAQTPNATTTTSIRTQMRQQQPYRQVPQPQVTPAPLRRTNSTPIQQAFQQLQRLPRQQSQQHSLTQQQDNHQHHHFLRRRSGNS